MPLRGLKTNVALVEICLRLRDSQQFNKPFLRARWVKAEDRKIGLRREAGAWLPPITLLAKLPVLRKQ